MTQPTQMAQTAKSYFSAALNAVRIPVTFAGLTATMLAGEAAMRVIGTGGKMAMTVIKPALNYVGSYVNLTSVSEVANTVTKQLPAVSLKLMRPFKDISHRELGISILACTAISAIGWKVCNQLMGPAPKWYDMITKLIGPFNLDSEGEHPVIAYARSWMPASKQT